MTRIAIRWSLLPLEVVLGYVLVGFAAVFAADQMGLWYEPFAGFFAAVAVVCVAYFRAPAWPVLVAFVAYSIGCWAAHRMLWESSYFPENYAEAYEPTNLPFWVTLAGGTLAARQPSNPRCT